MRSSWLPIAVVLLVLFCRSAHADLVELLNGIRVEGDVVSQTPSLIVIRASMGGGSAEMKFPVSKVHAVTVDGKRRVLNEKPDRTPAGEPGAQDESEAETSETPAQAGRTKRTRAEVEALIGKEGTTPPDWWSSVRLEYPKSLDLSWPDKPQGPWDASKNVGQYIWSVINENPGKWKSGVRFLHYLLTVHKDDPDKLAKVMATLGGKYIGLLDDPARAAFWYRKAHERLPLGLGATIRLAECYWKLGSKAMAAQQLSTIKRYVTSGMVKLWSDMGELNRALGLASALVRAGAPAEGYLAAGDACRLHARYKQALDYYQKVLGVPAEGKRKGRIEQCHTRARANIEGIQLFDALDLRRVADGTYTGTSTAYAGPLSVSVTVRGGRIEEVRVTDCKDKQYYGALTETPRQIVDRQGLKGVDAVTSATITSEAITNATAKALASGMK